MAPNPARDVLSVSDEFAVVNDPFLGTVTLSISALPRPELMRAASIRFPGAGVLWRNMDNPTIVTAIQSGVVPEPVVPVTLPPLPPQQSVTQWAETVEWAPSPTVFVDVPAPVPTTNGKSNADAAELAALLKKIAGSSLDTTAVKAIVAESFVELIPQLTELITNEVGVATEKIIQPQIINVQINNAPPVEITGTHHAVFPSLVRILGSISPVTSRHPNVYLVGPPGTGKTHMAAEAARALGLDYGAISCSPTMPDSRLQGFIDASGTFRDPVFYRIFTGGGAFLFDEIDNSHPGILAAMNQALANSECSFPNGMQRRHPDFCVVAAANTYGTGATRLFNARNALDAATLDRFIFLKVLIDESLEESITLATNPNARPWLESVRQWRAAADSHKLEVVISPRASYDGALLLSQGFTFDECKEMLVAKGMSDDSRRKVFGA